uniref:hypothetical protein n=1 Tax=Limnohabitans sp. TaxID=1907725 RepID=UPI0035AFC27B
WSSRARATGSRKPLPASPHPIPHNLTVLPGGVWGGHGWGNLKWPSGDYFKNWYPAIVFSAIFLVGCVNFAFDLFNVYAEILAKPTPKTTLMLFLRIIALWFLFLSVRNASRLPDLKDRLNIFLPYKRKV